MKIQKQHPILVPACLALLGALLVPAPSRAGGCMVSADAVAFGGYGVFDPEPTSTSGKISYACGLPVEPPVIKLSAGRSSSFTPRKMASASGTLDYNLFLDASATTIWGDGTAGSSPYFAPAPADGQNYEVTVFGRIPERQRVKAGSYSDTIVVTIEF